ncbi:MAG: ABC transporter substrate-binding protein [Spirochaetes bacterium]|nr:ABC transporter substrate-binding protein [Spirochaetota bacterium]
MTKKKCFLTRPSLKAALGAALVLSMALFFTGCGGQAEARTDTLIVGVPSLPVQLDPTLANDIASARVNSHIYNTLVYVDYDMIPRPSLATSWEWVDPDHPTQLRVFLREGVLFHNGDVLTASDVAFSLNRASTSPAIASTAGMISYATVVNDHEVLITLDHPFVPFVTFLGHTAQSIFSERAVTEMGDAHSQNPVGTGPFRLVNVVAGDHVELARWEHFWDTPALVETLIVRFLPDAATRLIALETGEIDIMITVPPADLARVQNHAELTLHNEMAVGTHYIAFNTSRPPFNDIRLRHAVQYALNVEMMVGAAFMGAMPRTTGPINSTIWASAADRLEPFPFNQDRARELLAEAGVPDGFSTTFFTNQGNAPNMDVAEITQNMLGAVGIDVSVQILEWATFLGASNNGEPDMIVISWNPTTGDPDQGLFPTFHSSTHGAGGNRAFFSNPEVDALLQAGRMATDPVERANIYYQIQQIIRDESPWVFLAAATEAVGVRNNVQGFRVAPNLRHKFWTLSLN